MSEIRKKDTMDSEEIKLISGTLKKKTEGLSKTGNTYWHLTIDDGVKEWKFFYWAVKCEIPIGREISVSYITKQKDEGGIFNEAQGVKVIDGGKANEIKITTNKGIHLKEGVQERMEEKVANLTKFVNGEGDNTDIFTKNKELLKDCYDAVVGICGGKITKRGEFDLVLALFESVRSEKE